MFEITSNTLWAVTYFFLFFYFTLLFTLIFYILPQTNRWANFSFFQSSIKNHYQTGFDFLYPFVTFIIILFLLNYTWTSCSITTWFGHCVYTSLQRKFVFLTLMFFSFTLFFFSSTFVIGSQEINDYFITCFSFYLWTVILFFANTLFSIIFLIEILSTLILLLSITSSFSRTYESHTYASNWVSNQSLQPALIYFKGLFLFFWISLISSLSLFLFLVFFYLQFFTFDCVYTEFILLYISNIFDHSLLFSCLLAWAFFIFSVFLKCGLVPFYFWKPIFFRSLSLHALFFYVVFFYFFICLFFLLLFFLNLNELLYAFGFIFNSFLFLGIISLFILLCEAQYVKIFIAFSSILNTLFVFLILTIDSSDIFMFSI